jgi:hypothetical protein
MYVQSSVKSVFPKIIPRAILATAAVAALTDICLFNSQKEIPAKITPVIREREKYRNDKIEKNGIKTAIQNLAVRNSRSTSGGWHV